MWILVFFVNIMSVEIPSLHRYPMGIQKNQNPLVQRTSLVLWSLDEGIGGYFQTWQHTQIVSWDIDWSSDDVIPSEAGVRRISILRETDDHLWLVVYLL